MKTNKNYLSNKKYWHSVSYILFIFSLLFPFNLFTSQASQTTSTQANQPTDQSTQTQPPTDAPKVELPEVDIAIEPPAEIKILPIELPEGVTLEALTLDIPLLGTIKLNPEKNKKTGEDYLRATLGSRKIGPIDIDDAEIIMRAGDKISIQAKTNLFGKRGTLSLQDLTRTSKLDNAKEGVSKWEIGRVHLRLNFLYNKAQNIDERPNFSILPDQKVTLNTINVILERNKPINLYSNILLFGQPVKLTFNFDKNVLGVNFSMKKWIHLSSIVSPLSGTPFANLTFKDINFTTSKRISKNEIDELLDETNQEPQTTFSGIIDFTSLWGGNAPEEKPTEAQNQADQNQPQDPNAPPAPAPADQNAPVQGQAQAPGTGASQTQASTNPAIITPEGPVNAHSQRAFNYFKSLIPSKYVTAHEQPNDGSVVQTKTDEKVQDEKLKTQAETKLTKAEIEAEKLKAKTTTDTKGGTTTANQPDTTSATATSTTTGQSSSITSGDRVIDLNAPVNNLQVNGTYGKKAGMHFEALVANLQLPVIGRVNNTKFVFDYKPSQTKTGKTRKHRANLVLSGDGTVSIAGLGNLEYTLASEYQKGGFGIEAILRNKINFKGVTLSDATLTVKPKQRILIISGHTKISTLDLIANLEVKRDENKKQTITFNANTQIGYMRPFAGTHIPIIEDFVVHDLTANVKLAITPSRPEPVLSKGPCFDRRVKTTSPVNITYGARFITGR